MVRQLLEERGHLSLERNLHFKFLELQQEIQFVLLFRIDAKMFFNYLKISRQSRSRNLLWLIYFSFFVVFGFSAIYFIPNTLFQSQHALNATSSSFGSLATAAPRSVACHPKRNIFFLKTHKCASSTVQNVFLRYGATHDLNFVLPTLGNYLGNQAPFHRAMTAMAPWHRLGYNVFCHHTVFSESETAAILPKDSVYVTIVRDPVTLFESLYAYARLDLHYKQNVEEFAIQRKPEVATFKDRAEGYLGVNQMAYDMGIRPGDFANETAVRAALRRLELRFDLVMLAERFDESMVLLSDLLCWPLEDVAYFRHNARREEAKRHLAVDTVERLRKLNSLDERIYRIFEKHFRRKLTAFGKERMKKEVTRLRRINAHFRRFCLEEGAANDSSAPRQGIFKAFSSQVQELAVKRLNARNATCQHMSKSEIAFTSQLKMSQTMKALGKRSFDQDTLGDARAWFQQLSQEGGFVPVKMGGVGNVGLSD